MAEEASAAVSMTARPGRFTFMRPPLVGARWRAIARWKPRGALHVWHAGPWPAVERRGRIPGEPWILGHGLDAAARFARSLRTRGRAGPRRHGDRVPGARHPSRPRGRDDA